MFVNYFRPKYLGHIIDITFCDNDINREVKNLFTRTNLLYRWFKHCSKLVKIRLFVPFVFVCTTLHCGLTVHSVLLTGLNHVTLNVSVTGMLMELGILSFNTLIHNYNVSFENRLKTCENILVKRIVLFNP